MGFYASITQRMDVVLVLIMIRNVNVLRLMNVLGRKRNVEKFNVKTLKVLRHVKLDQSTVAGMNRF